MMKKVSACIVLVVLSVAKLFSQKVEYNNSVQDFITKSTPQAYQFQKYGDLPVNYNTGVAEISVPMFSINIKNVNWNIGLTYHAGGVKVNEVSGCVGLGWNLNAAGMITARTFQRADVLVANDGDMSANKRVFNLNPSTPVGGAPECQYVNPTDMGIVYNLLEARENGVPQNYIPDIFYLNAGPLNAKFFLKNNHYGYCMPSKDIIIQHYPGLSYNNLGDNSDPGSWIITDEKGTKYTFEWGGGNATSTENENNTPDGAGGTSPLASYNYNPTFVLTKIENTSGERITFSYTKEYYFYKGNNSDIYHHNYPPPDPQHCQNPIDGFAPIKSHYNYVIESRLDAITSTTGESILFEYSPRSDLPGAGKLNRVTEYFKTISDNSFVKAYELTNAYFGSGTEPRELRLKLIGVTETGSGNNQQSGQYSFEYNATPLPSRISAAQDYFGYYNGQDNNFNLVPVYGGNRTLSFMHTKASVLEKVTYPTGGYTTLEYELKEYGGLRIKKKTDYTLGQGYNYKEYQYSGTYFAPGTPLAFPKFTKDINNYFTFCASPGTGQQVGCPLQENYSEPVQTLYETYYGIDNTERYAGVAEYSGLNGANGVTGYSYGLGLTPFPGLLGTEDLLTGKSISKKNGNIYEPVSQEVYNYALLNNENWGNFYADPVNAREARVWGIDFDREKAEVTAECVPAPICFPAMIWQQSVRFISTPVMLTSLDSYVWDAATGAQLHTVKNFTYDINKNLLPKTTTAWDSKGNKIIEKTSYPTDYIGITENTNPSAGIKNLYTIHDLVSPVERMTYRENGDGSNNRLIAATFTSYKPAAPVPETLYAIETNTGTNDFFPSFLNGGSISMSGEYKEKILFSGYNSSNDLTELQKKDDNKNSYVWLERQTDYNGGKYRIPAAVVVNASQNEIACTSFETGLFDFYSAGGSGNWTYGAIPTDDASAPTGKKAYGLSGGSITKSNLNPSAIYTVSYWSKSGQQTVSSTTSVATGKTIGAWTYYEHKITSPAGGNVTVSGAGIIDELRLYPAGAQMNSYTYGPLIGMTTQCDANNRITYYEYDAFNRLKLIRDQDGNILKTYDYKYQQ